MKLQQRTYDRIVENLESVKELFTKDKSTYSREDFKDVSSEMGISVSRIRRAYENLSEFGFVHLGLGPLSNAEVVPNKPVVKSKKARKRAVDTYIKRKDRNYVEVAKRIIHDRIFTNQTVKEIATKWNCSTSRVGNLVTEVARYGAIKLPKFNEHSLINIKRYKDTNVKELISVVKNDTDLSQSIEKQLRHKLLVRVLKDSLKPATETV